jgi:hypothetical protein
MHATYFGHYWPFSGIKHVIFKTKLKCIYVYNFWSLTNFIDGNIYHMLRTITKFVVAGGKIWSVRNIMYHNGINCTKRKRFACAEFPLADAVVNVYEVIPLY